MKKTEINCASFDDSKETVQSVADATPNPGKSTKFSNNLYFENLNTRCKSCDRSDDCIMLNSSLGFKELADKFNYGVCIINQDMRHMLFNNKYQETLKYSCSELLGMTLTDFVDEEYKTTVSETIWTIFEGIHTQKKIVSTMVRKDGKSIVVEISNSKINWMGETAVIVTTKDLTRWYDEKSFLCKKISSHESKIEALAVELKQKIDELGDYRSKFDMVKSELVQTNRAMSILARNIDKEKKDIEQNVCSVVITKVMPFINNLKKTPSLKKYEPEFDVLSEYIYNILPDKDLNSKLFVNFTETEVRVVTMIKNGMPSQKIADALNISIETIKTHRKKIRKKLNIQNTDTNLQSYLKTLRSESS